MKQSSTAETIKHPDPHHDLYSRTIFGFWLFLLTDFVLFGTLIACYVVLGENTYGGPSALELFNNEFALLQTFLMLLMATLSGLGELQLIEKIKISHLFFLL